VQNKRIRLSGSNNPLVLLTEVILKGVNADDSESFYIFDVCGGANDTTSESCSRLSHFLLQPQYTGVQRQVAQQYVSHSVLISLNGVAGWATPDTVE